jgi:hypothetical protein
MDENIMSSCGVINRVPTCTSFLLGVTLQPAACISAARYTKWLMRARYMLYNGLYAQTEQLVATDTFSVNMHSSRTLHTTLRDFCSCLGVMNLYSQSVTAIPTEFTCSTKRHLAC